MRSRQIVFLVVVAVLLLSLISALAVSGYFITEGPGRLFQSTRPPATPEPATETPISYPAPATPEPKPKPPKSTKTADPYPVPDPATATRRISQTLTAIPTDYLTPTAPLPECGAETTVPCFTATPKAAGDD